MPSPGWIRIVIALAALAMVVVSLLSGDSEGSPGLRSIGIASGAVTLALLLFDRWAWRWRGVRWLSELTGSRVLHGTFRGTFNYLQDGDGNPGTGPIYLAVYQTYSQISIRSFFPLTDSSSISLLAGLHAEDHRHLLRYVFQHEAPAPDREHNRSTQGVCELAVVGKPVTELSGSYYAERGGKGTISLFEHAVDVAGSVAHAESLTYTDLRA
jgi:hypothetical protein